MTGDASGLTLTQQAGQRLMVGFDGLELNDELKYFIKEVRVGGLILFSRNIDSPEQIRSLCRSVQAFAARQNVPPLLIGIDQEGGTVARLKPPFTQFPGNPFMKTTADAQRFARITSQELKRIGVNINMAPVLDVADPEGGSVMHSRVFGPDPDWVARMGCAVIQHLQSGGVMAVGKHFPGIGRTVLDSHEELPDLMIDKRTLLTSDLLPFKAAIHTGVTAIMLSHIRYTDIDPVWPASMSPIVARDLLRGDLGFSGLVLTDDIDMGALSKHYNISSIVRQCLDAEIDMVLICHPGPKIDQAHNHICDLLKESESVSRSGLRAIGRIMGVKRILKPET